MASQMVDIQDFADIQGKHMSAGGETYQPYEFEREDAWQDDGASSVHHSSGPEGEEDEQIFDLPSPQSSPRTSRSPSDISEDDFLLSRQTMADPSTPRKRCSPFRNPSSVRAMHTDITPPRLSNPSTQRKSQPFTPSRRGTPASVQSRRGTPRTPSKMSPGKKIKKEYPLILLHITLLPLTMQYSMDILESTLPPSTLANLKLLQEKHAQTILDRGLLIPHPREDYDLLEERLLESLELKLPRVLKCGHFHLSPEEEADIEERESDVESDAGDSDICHDCGRRIRDGHFGDAGSGSKRWDIKIYAANGLMRAGAWSAAWKEMERVDAEITPWIEDSLKRELELRKEEEERHRLEEERAMAEEGIGSLDDERLREIYGQNPPPFGDGAESHSDPKDNTPLEGKPPAVHRYGDLSLGQLLTKFIYVAARDRRNIAIFCLSIVVLLMSLRMGPQKEIVYEGPGSTSASDPTQLMPEVSQSSVVFTNQEPIPTVAAQQDTEINIEETPERDTDSKSVEFPDMDQITEEMLSD